MINVGQPVDLLEAPKALTTDVVVTQPLEDLQLDETKAD